MKDLYGSEVAVGENNVEREREKYIEANYLKLEGSTREAVEDAFESAWIEQQNKLDQILSLLDRLQYSGGERIYKEVKEFLK